MQSSPPGQHGSHFGLSTQLIAVVLIPIGSMGLVYLPTCTINLSHLTGKYTVRPMDPIGLLCGPSVADHHLNGMDLPTDLGASPGGIFTAEVADSAEQPSELATGLVVGAG